jgi:hypothetical protein
MGTLLDRPGPIKDDMRWGIVVNSNAKVVEESAKMAAGATISNSGAEARYNRLAKSPKFLGILSIYKGLQE